MKRRIDQLLAGFADGDAISQEAVAMQALFRELGFESDLFAVTKHVSPGLKDKCRDVSEYAGTADDLVILHYAIGSATQDIFLAAPGRKILVYHNITPAHFYDGFDDDIADSLRGARDQLAHVARAADAVWADSAYNAGELKDLGIEKARVLNLIFDAARLDLPEDPNVAMRFQPPLTTWLYTGRIAPNKNVEGLIEAFYWYHRTINHFSRLMIVGSERSCPRYFTMLRMQVADLDMPNVCFEGFASPGGLPTYFRSADVYVSTSNHEGYCLPLLEAMYLGTPVVAHGNGGVPDAMQGAGAMYEELTPPQIAQLVHHVISDTPTRQAVVDSQAARVKAAMARDSKAELIDLLRQIDPELI